MAKGGKQPGAGRPKGSYNVPKFRDVVSDEEKEKFKEFILDTYMGDMRVALWVADQFYGKAPQAIDVTSGGEKLPSPILLNVPSDNGATPDKEAH